MLNPKEHVKRVSMVVWNDFRNDARVRKEAETLQAAGYQVTVFALHTPGVTQRDEQLACGVRVARVMRSPVWYLRKGRRQQQDAVRPAGTTQRSRPRRSSFLRGLGLILTRSWTHALLMRRLATSRPDVIHAHDVNTLPTAWLAAIAARAQLVYDAHEISTSREGYARFRKAVGWVEKRLMPRAAATITTTEARARFFARAYHIPRPLVLQNRPRLQVQARGDRIRRELQLRHPWPIVLYQGGLQKGRGLERLLDAAAHIEKAYFVFIGGGRLTGPLLQKARDARLTERVHFIPTVSLDDLPQYTASADIGVQPIENTCFNHFTTDSNKLFEYLMAGLPVVASDMPEIRRIIDEYDFGILVPPGDTEALAQGLESLVNDERLRQHLAGNALNAAVQLNWESQEDELVAIYDRVLRDARSARFGPDIPTQTNPGRR